VWEIEQERIPPFARNTIIFGPNTSIATGFLGNSWIDLSIFRGIPANKFELLNIEWEGQIYVVGRSIGKFMIYSYEPADLTRTIGGKFLLWGILSVFLFAIGIFALSLRIARHTLAPIEAARERSKSYNRYLAHELKTPLSIVMSELELARATATYDADLNASSLEEIKSMSDIISGLLLLSEAERSPSRTQVPLSAAVQSITSELQKIATYHDRVFEISIPSEAFVMAEPILLHTLIKNLLLNALKHGAPGIITIVYSSKGLMLSNPLLPNTTLNLPGIFEEFTGTPGAGNGLGLSLCKRITDMHGWTLTLEQAPHHRLEANISFGR
jgi:signal transduction histidine kinase